MPLADPLIGHNLANYHIERLLGRGGMASVYYGFDTHLRRPAAIKVIDDRYSGDASYAARFVQEARAMASWRHPAIPQIYQAGVENGISFYAMEYINGMDLEELLRQYRQKSELLPYKDILLIATAIAEALDYAHQKGAIHRDVKPSNVLISDDDRILLTDFGLVLEVDKGTKGEVFGSPQYIAPEQARSSADAVPQSDLYALGVVLYEMLVGKLPFEDPSPASLAIKHITLDPPAPRLINPDLSPEVERFLLKALQKQPQARYQTGKTFIAALEDAIPNPSSGIRTFLTTAPPPATLAFLPDESGNQPSPAGIKSQSTDFKGQDRAIEPPEGPVYPLEENIPASNQPLHPAFPKAKYIIAAILALGVLVFLCVFVFGSAWLVGKLRRPTPTGAFQTSATPIVSQIQLTLTPTALAASFTPSPTSAPEFHLSLSAQKTDSFLVINQSTSGIPLAQLQFGTQKNKLSGSEWGIDVLQPGQCVTVIKSEGKSEPPNTTACERVGKVLTRGGPAKFWDSVFNVYYQNVLVATCDLKNDACDLQFSPSP